MIPPRVKICGVTRVEDALLAVDQGAEFVGLNFWPRSPRYLTLEAARPIAEAIAGRTRLVGVWVDPDRDQAATLAGELGLDLFQFHGDEEPTSVSWFPGRVIKALRVEVGFHGSELNRFEDAWGFLFDCAPAGTFGGTGRSWSYERIAVLETPKPILLAGGLDPGNVARAVVASGADIVDVCSGIEASPGVKDAELLEQFIREVQNVESRE